MSKIMIVDDDATIQMEMEEYLNHMDYTVVGISDTGSGAVEMARELKPQYLRRRIRKASQSDFRALFEM